MEIELSGNPGQVKGVFNICYSNSKIQSWFWPALSLLLALFLLVAIFVGPAKGETLTSEQYQSLISNLNQAKSTLQMQSQAIQKLKQNSTEEQNQISQLLQQLDESQQSMSQANQDLTQQMTTISNVQSSLTDALTYSKKLEKEIKWLKIRGWLLLGLGILTGHFI